MRKLNTSLPACLAVALALVAGGCNAQTRSTGRVALGLATDNAYLTVLSAQNDSAVAYSKVILKTTSSNQVKEFADRVITSRADEAKAITDLEHKDASSDTFTLPDAAAQLGHTLAHLGVAANGRPLTPPSTDKGYVAAMTANGKSVLTASNVDTKNGSPGVVPFAKNVIIQRTNELETLRNMPQ